MVGQQIGSYLIERKLGEGGMGVVYVGVDVRLGRRAAIKQLLPALSGDRAIVERFFNEAKAAASVNHPGIVEIYDVGWHTDGSAYFAMKMLEGDSLAGRLRTRGPMPAQLAATIARQIASALAAAHARGIVHRDLKPDNVVLVPDDEVAIGERATVLDFGIAKLFGEGAMTSKTRTGSVMGTPYYMSPEQCRGAGEIDHRTDVYALGCLVFEMLTGRPPFVAEGAGEILGMHQFVAAPTVRSLRADVPAELEAVVMRALAKTADQRQQSMVELTAALQPFATQGARSFELAAQRPSGSVAAPAVTGQPSTLGGSAGQYGGGSIAPRSRRGALIAIGGAVVVVAAVVIAIAASSGGKPAAPTPTPIAAAGTVDAAPLPESIAAPVAVDAGAAPIVAAEVVVDAGTAAASNADQVAFEALKRAIAAEDFSRAFTQWDKIPASSSFRRDGRDELVAAAQTAVFNGDSGRALVIAERVLASTPRDAALIALAGVAACSAKSEAKARKYYGKLGASDPGREQMRKRCGASGVELEAAVAAGSGSDDQPPPPAGDAKKLTDDAGAAAMEGAWGRALRLAEEALRIDPDLPKAITVAALASCALKNEAKARQYYARASKASQQMLRMRCLATAKFDPGVD